MPTAKLKTSCPHCSAAFNVQQQFDGRNGKFRDDERQKAARFQAEAKAAGRLRQHARSKSAFTQP